jgi:hypothetical protein
MLILRHRRSGRAADCYGGIGHRTNCFATLLQIKSGPQTAGASSNRNPGAVKLSEGRTAVVFFVGQPLIPENANGHGLAQP